MKNFSNRTKILLGIAALVLVVVVAALVLLPVSGLPLFSTAISYSITPSNPAIMQGSTVTLTENSPYPCNWAPGNTNVVTVLLPNTNVSTVTVKGIAAVQSPIYANCWLGTNQGWQQLTTTVTVNAPPTPTPTIPPKPRG